MFKARLPNLILNRRKELSENPYVDKVKRKLKRYKIQFEETLEIENNKLIIVIKAI